MANKGGQFEREISKRLGLWWANDDDIFWRSSNSGGRVTNRWNRTKKQGVHGHGDIVATTSTGAPLLRMFTIECKKGYSHISPFDVIEQPVVWREGYPKFRPVDKIISQAAAASVMAQSLSWLWIHGRSMRNITYVTDADMLKHLPSLKKVASIIRINPDRPALIRYGIRALLVCTEQDFLSNVTPDEVRKAVDYD